MRLLPLACLLLAACVTPSRQAAPDEAPVTAVAIPLDTADRSRTSVGRLRYMGGLHLTSPDRRFGSLSGLRWDGEALVAVSDQGDFFRLPVIEQDGRLTGVGRVRIVRLTEAEGRPFINKEDADAEAIELGFDAEECASIARCPSAMLSVSFEQRHRIWGYALKDGMPAGRPRVLWQPEDHRWLASLPANGGVEAMADWGHGASIVIAEKARHAGGGAVGVLYHNGLESDAAAEHRQVVGLAVRDGFEPTDAVFDDRLIVVSRNYQPGRGVAARIEAFPLFPAGGGRTVRIDNPELLAELRAPLSVDNMEGLAIRREGERTFLYLVSDDNFSPAQRTLLMKFELMR